MTDLPEILPVPSAAFVAVEIDGSRWVQEDDYLHVLGNHDKLAAELAAVRKLLAGTVSPAPPTLHIVFDKLPGAEPARFIEVETADGKSVDAGQWHLRADGHGVLILAPPEKGEPNPDWEAIADGAHDAGIAEFGVEPAATLNMLKTWKADAEPANHLGQVTFSRAMLDAATDVLEALLAASAEDTEDHCYNADDWETTWNDRAALEEDLLGNRPAIGHAFTMGRLRSLPPKHGVVVMVGDEDDFEPEIQWFDTAAEAEAFKAAMTVPEKA